jgi:hypothetical protein
VDHVTDDGLYRSVPLASVSVSLRLTHPFSECPAEFGDKNIDTQESLLTERHCIVCEERFSIVGVLLLCKEHHCQAESEAGDSLRRGVLSECR